eukprot:8345304-Alexandrium_andersonii.AAC.1
MYVSMGSRADSVALARSPPAMQAPATRRPAKPSPAATSERSWGQRRSVAVARAAAQSRPRLWAGGTASTRGGRLASRRLRRAKGSQPAPPKRPQGGPGAPGRSSRPAPAPCRCT